MLNLIAAIRRKPGMTHQAFLHYLQHVHGSLATANQLHIRQYIQNHVFDSSFGSAEDPTYLTDFGRDSVTELHFESLEALAATMSDSYSRKVVGPDGAHFNDMPSALALLTSPVALIPPPTDEGQVKVLHFVHMAEGLDLGTFTERWQATHEKVLGREELHAKALRGYVQHRQVPGAEKLLSHFGGRDKHVYEGVAALYYASADDALTHFPAYEQSLRERSAEAGDFYDPSRSFALYSQEVTIFPEA